MNKIIIPLIILIIISYGIYKKNNIYEMFLDGAKEGLFMVVEIIPTIIAMIFAVNIFLKSNILSNILSNIVSFIINIFNVKIPFELIAFALLRPISGNATLALLNNILITYGPDSFMGLLSSTMQGCTDTTIYVLALYFASIKVTNSRYALFVGLFADLIGIIASIIFVYIFFG